MSYIVCVLAFGLYWLASKRMPARLKGGGGGSSSGKGGGKGGGGGGAAKVVAFIPFTLLAIATMTLADTQIGVWMSRGIEWLLAFPAGWFGVSAAVVAAVVFTLIAIGAVFDLIDLKPDGLAKTAVWVLPFLVLVATGPFAAQGAGLFDAVSQTGSETMRMIVGQ